MLTEADAVLSALKESVASFYASPEWNGGDVQVARNLSIPEEVTGGGLVIIRDGRPGEPEGFLGNMGPYYYQHVVEVELYVSSGSEAQRDALWKDLVGGLGSALRKDHTLGGLVIGMSYGQPDANAAQIEGAEVIKSASLPVTIDYETEFRL